MTPDDFEKMKKLIKEIVDDAFGSPSDPEEKAKRDSMIKKSFEFADALMNASWWDWKGDPACRDGYTVLGTDDDGQCITLREYNPLGCTVSVPISEGILGEWVMTKEKATDLAQRIAVLDKHYYGAFRPRVVQVVDLQPAEIN